MPPGTWRPPPRWPCTPQAGSRRLEPVSGRQRLDDLAIGARKHGLPASELERRVDGVGHSGALELGHGHVVEPAEDGGPAPEPPLARPELGLGKPALAALALDQEPDALARPAEPTRDVGHREPIVGFDLQDPYRRDRLHISDRR